MSEKEASICIHYSKTALYISAIFGAIRKKCHLLPKVILNTFAEVMISITYLEFSYTQAPKSMKSFITGLLMASVALANLFTALVNQFTAEDLSLILTTGFSPFVSP